MRCNLLALSLQLLYPPHSHSSFLSERCPAPSVIAEKSGTERSIVARHHRCHRNIRHNDTAFWRGALPVAGRQGREARKKQLSVGGDQRTQAQGSILACLQNAAAFKNLPQRFLHVCLFPPPLVLGAVPVPTPTARHNARHLRQTSEGSAQEVEARVGEW